MRLAWRVFLSTSLVMLVLVGIAAWSLQAVNGFVHTNATIVERTVPALRLETSLREALVALVRLESRWGLLRDPRYAARWEARAERAGRELDALSALLTHPEELRYHHKSTTSFAMYRHLVLGPRPTTKTQPLAGEPRARLAAARTQLALERLTDATADALERSRHDARRLERRTRNALVAALPVAGLAGLAGASLVAFGMARALRRLSTAPGEIAAGTFPEPVAVRGSDEIAQLGDAFNRLARQPGRLDRLKPDFF